MDRIFNPTQRKWISPPVNVGECMEEMKKLVRLQEEELLIINPTPMIEAPTSGASAPADFLASEAMQFEGEGEGEAEALERLKRDLAERSRVQWAKDDTICEEAVAAVGGEDFFLFKKKKKNKKQKRRGRRSKAELEEDSEDEDDSDELYEDDEDEAEELDADAGDATQEVRMDAKMYENFNYNEERPKSQQRQRRFDEKLQRMRTTDEEVAKIIEDLVPQCFEQESDDDLDFLEFDDITQQAAGFAQRLEDIKRQALDSDQECSDNDDCAILNSSDEEKDAESQVDKDVDDEGAEITDQNKPSTSATKAPDGTVDDGEKPCCSKSIPKAPLKSIQSSAAKEKKGIPKRATINPKGNVKYTVEEPSSSTTSPSATNKEAKGKEGEAPSSKLFQSDLEDFKRFTDWVFNHNNRKDQERKLTDRLELMQKFNLNEGQVRYYQSMTSANLASVPGEVFQDDPVLQSSSMPLLAPPTGLDAPRKLQSLAVFITHGEDPSVFPWKSINVQQQMNDDFFNHEFLQRMEQQKRDLVNPAMKNELVNKEDDFLLQVLIYQATDPDEVLPDEVKIYVEPRLAYEVHFLGSQTVKDLMNSFHCENSYICLKDTPHPDDYVEDPSQYAKAVFSNAMILIDDIIYTDPACTTNYVEVVNNWAAKQPEKNVGPFKSGDWNTKLRDLTLSFGFPYVYIHLGGCEHVYVFSKSRLLHVEDDHLLKSYPKIIGMTRFKNVYCRVDNEYLARWAVLDFKEFPENPMLLCTECVLMYCYDKQKKKRGNFRLYPYTQMANIL